MTTLANSGPTLYVRMGGHKGILEFIRPFYMDIRQHQVLGPIFNAQIQDWESHLVKIAEFWSLQTGGTSLYRGGFAGAHLKLDLEPELFDIWLTLWDYNCQRQLSPELAESMSAMAHEMARRLKRVIATKG
ncbi:group III truncated hemoglobin [bacterium]|nr:group III truncated hemoglobin [bacterium]